MKTVTIASEESIELNEAHSIGTGSGNGGVSHRRSRKKMIHQTWKAYLFLTPILLSMGLFKYYPFFTAIVKSFYDWNAVNINRFVGLANFSDLFYDEVFHISLRNILILTVCFVVIQLTLPLLAAVTVSHIGKPRLQNVYKTLFLVPLVVPYIIVYLLWKWIYRGDYGVLNEFLIQIGLERWTHAWLGESKTALFAIIGVGFPWIGGIFFLIYLAGLMTISKDLYEVGKMDGVKPLRRLLHIELPLIRSQIRLVIILAFIQHFQSFENVLILTNGGPGFTTITPALYLYKRGFEYNDLGYASSIGVVIFVILILFTIAANRFIRHSDKID